LRGVSKDRRTRACCHPSRLAATRRAPQDGSETVSCSRRSAAIRFRMRRQPPCLNEFDSYQARCSAIRAISSVRSPCSANIAAAARSMMSRRISRGRTVPSHSSHSSVPQIGARQAASAIQMMTCLKVSTAAIRSSRLSVFKIIQKSDYLKSP
jgi:hypothetical protein